MRCFLSIWLIIAFCNIYVECWGFRSPVRITRIARRVGGGIVDAGKATGKGVVNVGKATGTGVVDAGKATGKGVVVAGKAIAKGVTALVKGCCGFKAAVCNMEKEFERRQKDIKAKSALMDRDWITVKKTLARIKEANNLNTLIYQNVRRITKISAEALTILDPQIMVSFNNVKNRLTKAVSAKNETVLKYGINEISDEMDEAGEGTQTALLDATGVGGFGVTEGYIKMTSDMFRMVKLDMVADFLDSDVSGLLQKAKLGISKLFGFHLLEQMAKQNKILGVVFKGLEFYTTYLSFTGNIFKAMEGVTKIIAYVTDVASCNSRGDKISDAVKQIRTDHNKLLDSLKELENMKKNLKETWTTVREQVTKDSLMESLLKIEDIALQSSKSNGEFKKARSQITLYRMSIGRATDDGTISLQKQLVDALKKIGFTMECYNRRTAVFEAVYRRCKAGERSFQALWRDALTDFQPNDDECKSKSGLDYTTIEDVQNHIKVKAERENFEENCLLNSGAKWKLVCEMFYQHYNIIEISNLTGVDENTIKVFLRSCPVPTLSPADKLSVCSLKTTTLLTDIVRAFPVIDDESVAKVYAACRA